jgi:hypothetical protein
MQQTTSSSIPLPIQSALAKFYATNENLEVTEDLLRRVFFEYLRSKPNLTTEQAEILETVSDLLTVVLRKSEE